MTRAEVTPDCYLPLDTGRGLRVIVTGGRDFFDRARVFAALDRLHQRTPIGKLVHGGAPGADTLATEWAEARGVAEEVHPAEWDRWGAAAGPRRNQEMVNRGADGGIAFPGGAGTADCTRRMRLNGIKVWQPFG